MAIVNDWLDWAVKDPGPAHKKYDTVNAGAGIVWHSAEGWWEGSRRELWRTDRQASWMFFIKIDGTLVQHYPVTASCWASGNSLANTQWWSVELEGLYTTPINTAQMATALRLISEWQTFKGLRSHSVPTRTGDLWTKTMWEHREVDTIATPNAGETACPSERYAPLWRALDTQQKVDASMTPEERALLNALVKNWGGAEKVLADARNDIDYAAGYASEQIEQKLIKVAVNAVNNAVIALEKRTVALERLRADIAKVLAQ